MRDGGDDDLDAQGRRGDGNLPPYGRRVRHMRNQVKLSQAELANLTGVSDETIKRIEACLVTPRPVTCRAINEVLIERYVGIFHDNGIDAGPYLYG